MDSGETSSGWRTAFYAVQFFFGGWFLAHGLNHWLEFFPRPSGSSPIARELIGALNHSGMFTIVKALEVVTGAMLLSNHAVPLAAVLAFPVTLSIAQLNIVANGDAFSLFVGAIIITLNGLIALGHLDKFLPMLTIRQGDPSLAGIRTLMQKGLDARPAMMGGPVHVVAIVLGIATPIAVTFWSTMDGGFRSKEAYRKVAEQAAAQGAMNKSDHP